MKKIHALLILRFLLIFLIIGCCVSIFFMLTSCGPRVDIPELTKPAINQKIEPKVIVKTVEGFPAMVFYGLGALSLVVAAVIAVVFKDLRNMIIAIGFGLLFCIIPSIVSMFQEILGPLKWAIIIIIFSLVACWLILLGRKLHKILQDYGKPEQPDILPETKRLRKKAQQKEGP